MSGCRLDFGSAVIETQNNVPVRCYVPVFDAQNPRQKTTRLFAQMDDARTLRLFLDMAEQSRFYTPQEQRLWFKAHGPELTSRRDLSCLLSRGIYRPTADLDAKFSGIADSASDQFLIIADGWQPNPHRGYLLAGIGAAGLLFAVACVLANLQSRRG